MEKLIGFIRSAVHSVLARRSQAEPKPIPALVYQGGETFFNESEKAWTTHFPVAPSYEFWWVTTGKPLARMLEWASYPLPSRSSYLSFYHRCILPEFGPFKAVGGESFTSSPLLSVPHKSKYFPSYMTDDHTPVEFSCIFDDEGTPTIRFSVDPVQRQEDRKDPAIAFFEDLAKTMPSLSSSDLTWCRICAEELTVGRHKGTLTSEPRYPSQYFAGFELSRSSTALKAYFLPETTALMTGIPKAELVTGLVRRICKDLSSLNSSPSLQRSWDMLLGFFQSLPLNIAPSIEIVAVDCVPSPENRLKVYVRTPLITLSTVKRFMTLDSAIGSLAISRALDQVSYFWELLFPGISNDEQPGIDEGRLRHPTSGLLFYYELRGDSVHPLPKVYIPVRHLCKSDEEIVQAMEKLYRKTNNLEAMRKYGGLLRDAFDHRLLSVRTGIHTYITFAAKPSNVEVTAYLNPECFGRSQTLSAL